MRAGHRHAQDQFLAAGSALGYRTRRTYSAEFPTDGVWLLKDCLLGRDIGVAAIEVIVTENKKTRQGSIHVLESVSPAVGIVLLHDEEIRRGMWRDGATDSDIEREINHREEHLRRLAEQSKQRIEVWRTANLDYVHDHALRAVAARRRAAAQKKKTIANYNNKEVFQWQS
jgi:hypothetical protein